LKLGEFLRVGVCGQPAKSLTGIGGSLDWCAPPDTQMAKVERGETVWKVLGRRLVTYAVLHGEHQIPHRSVRRGMALHQPAASRAHGTRTPQAPRLEGDPRCRLLLRAEERLPVAAFASRGPALEDSLRLVQQVAHRRGTWERLNAELRERLRGRLGRDPHPSAGIVDSQSARTSGGWEAKSAASIPPRMWKEESAICWWTPRVWCSKPSYTAPESLRQMASGCCC
jgi:transposase